MKERAALPLSLQWVDPLLVNLEKGLMYAEVRDLYPAAIMAAQQYGVPLPEKLLGNDVEWVARKVKSCLMTDGNTRIRENIRITLANLCLYSQAFQLDPKMFLIAAVKIVMPEVLVAASEANINRLHQKELNGDNS